MLTAIIERPIALAPVKMRRHGYSDAHSRPLVSKGKQPFLPFLALRTSPGAAWTYNQVELRTGNSYSVISLDLDLPNAHAVIWEAYADGRIPLPNWLTVRKANGHAHAVWTLRAAVHRGALATADPLDWLSRIWEYLTACLEADSNYNAVLVHNPVSRSRAFKTVWLQRRPYNLAELSACIPRGWKAPSMPATAPSRNTWLHREACRWQFRHRGQDPLPRLQELNRGLEFPLPAADVATIARSVRRWCERMTIGGGWYSEASFKAVQARRGRKSGQVRRAMAAERDSLITLELESGLSLRAIARIHDLSPGTVHHVAARRTKAG